MKPSDKAKHLADLIAGTLATVYDKMTSRDDAKEHCATLIDAHTAAAVAEATAPLVHELERIKLHLMFANMSGAFKHTIEGIEQTLAAHKASMGETEQKV